MIELNAILLTKKVLKRFRKMILKNMLKKNESVKVLAFKLFELRIMSRYLHWGLCWGFVKYGALTPTPKVIKNMNSQNNRNSSRVLPIIRVMC